MTGKAGVPDLNEIKNILHIPMRPALKRSANVKSERSDQNSVSYSGSKNFILLVMTFKVGVPDLNEIKNILHIPMRPALKRSANVKSERSDQNSVSYSGSKN